MIQPILSICIPTFNGSKTITGTLDSLLAQASPELEVVIGDNASTDETVNVCQSFQEKGLNIKMITNRVNLGFDLNLSNLIFSASGIYCWILGDDDYIKNGAINCVLNQLSQGNYDLITCNTLQIERHSSASHYLSPLSGAHNCRLYNSAHDYLSDFKTYSTFMSINIIKRARWQEFWRPDMVGRFFVHYEIILSFLKVCRPSICHIDENLVLKTVRSDEDSMAKDPMSRTHKLDIVIGLLEALNIHCCNGRSKVIADICKREVCRSYLLSYIRMSRVAGRRLGIVNSARITSAIWPSPLLIPAIVLGVAPYKPFQLGNRAYKYFLKAAMR